MGLLSSLRNVFASPPPSNDREVLITEMATRLRRGDWLTQFGGTLANPDVVLRRLGKGIEAYRDLLADAQIGGAVESRKAATRSLAWSLDGSKSDPAQVAIVQAMLDRLDMDRIWSELIDAALYGYQPLEVVWEEKGAYIIPAKVQAKPVEWFEFDSENHLRFRTNIGQTEVVPDRKFLVAQNEPSFNNPYGVAVLSRCWWPYTFKRGGAEFLITAAERFGMPWLWGKIPVGQHEAMADDFFSALDGMIQDGLIVTPDTWSVEQVGINAKASADLYTLILSWCDSQIAKAILGHTGTAESTSGKLGSENAAIQVREEIAAGDQRIVSTEMNTLVRWIYELNFPAGSKPPTFVLHHPDDVDLALAQRDEVLSKTGVQFSPGYYQRAYNLKADDFTIKPPSAPATAFSEAHPVPCPGCGAAFADGDSLPDDQRAADELVAMALDPKSAARQVAPLVAQIQKVLNGSGSYAEARARLMESYPKMDSGTIAEVMERAVFIADALGRTEANGEA